MKLHRGVALLASVVLLASCSGQAAPSVTDRPSIAATPRPQASTTPAAASAWVRRSCPNPYGGECLGRLRAGTYETTTFHVGLTYTVPDEWANYEDLPGNFLLVPPDSLLEEGDAGTGEYVGAFDGVAVPSGPPLCGEAPDPGFEPTPEGIIEALAARDGLSMTEPEPVSIGGLDGVVTDLTLEDGYTGTCPFSRDREPTIPILIGHGRAGLHHTLGPNYDVRLYVLAGEGDVPMVIEVCDVPGRQSIDELSAVVEQLRFGD